MDFKVIWSDSAINDLKEICDYIARDKPNAAEKVGRGILEHVKLLETFPLIGPRIRGARVVGFARLFMATTEFFMKC